MLTIRRRNNQGFYIGTSYVKILGVDAEGNVKIGVSSTEPVLREELCGDQNAAGTFFIPSASKQSNNVRFNYEYERGAQQ